ncbi:MAG: hypothetical protein JW384_04267 [Nitrosomonadaceae bacterium]|nr:hypothetical protein [Nitrosomonadaceae bacterium]
MRRMLNLLDSYREVSPGVFQCHEWGVALSTDIVKSLVDAARINPRYRARLCLHPGPEDIEQQMLIVMVEGAIDAPHMHSNKREAILPYLGTAEYQMFSQDGAVQKRIPLGAQDVIYVSSPLNVFHRIVLKDPVFAFWEFAQGPFTSDSTVHAPWPDPLVNPLIK